MSPVTDLCGALWGCEGLDAVRTSTRKASARRACLSMGRIEIICAWLCGKQKGT